MTGIAIGVAFSVTFVLGIVARWAGPKIGALDVPEGSLKTHRQAVSYLGGAAVATGLLAGIAVADTEWLVPSLRVVVPALAIGLLGDAVRASARMRLGLQLVVFLLVLPDDMRLAIVDERWLAVLGGVLLFVAAMNAVNMVDGMDGLAAGTAAISGIGIAAVASAAGEPWQPWLLMSAAAAGFLLHNAPRAGLFLGDCGAYVLGAMLAAGILLTGQTLPAFLGALSCLGLFGLDLILSVLRRIAGRVPLTGGDRGHFYDQLVARGVPEGITLLVCYALQAAMVYAGVLQSRLSSGDALVSFAVLWIVVIVAMFADGFVGYRSGPPESDLA